MQQNFSKQIHLKSIYFSKLLSILLCLSILISALIFLEMNSKVEYKYLLCMIFVFLGILCVFYLNRFESLSLKIIDYTIEVEYFNKFFFKKQIGVYRLNELKIIKNHEKISLFYGGNLVTVLRKNAMLSSDWEYFEKMKTY